MREFHMPTATKAPAHYASSSALVDSAFGSICKQIELFERAASYQGWPRERLVALGEAEDVYFRLFPHHYRALQTIRVASQLGKVCAVHHDPTVRCESRLLSILMNIIAEAVDEGDLKLRGRQTSGELAFTIWALALGTRTLMNTRVTTHQLGIQNGGQVGRDATELLLDALGWRPLSIEWAYPHIRERIRKTLFADELEQIRQLSSQK
jgi:hypothetical protein